MDHFNKVNDSIYRECKAHKEVDYGFELPTGRGGTLMQGKEWKDHVDEFCRDRLRKHSRFATWITIILIAGIIADNWDRF